MNNYISYFQTTLYFNNFQDKQLENYWVIGWVRVGLLLLRAANK